MTDRDPAFLWETEALRASPRRSAPPADPPAAAPAPTSVWSTIREAHDATGIPVGTLRKWARRGLVPSFVDEGREQPIRLVRMDAVVGRARLQGRTLAPRDGFDDQPVVVDLRDEPGPPQGGEQGRTAPPGTMIVPIAAWDKMLMQLGNLHEAGQQLAEARERAAKAETEAGFLRERLAELRAAQSTSSPPVPAADPGPRPDVVAIPPPPPRVTQLWRALYRTLRGPRR